MPTKPATNGVAGRSYTSAGEPTCSIRPLLKTAIRSDMVSASSWSCVTKRKVMPTWRWSSLSSTCICSRSLRSRAPSGSSSRSTLGPVDQRAGQGDALALAAGQLGGLAAAVLREPHAGERLGGLRRGARPCRRS